jgi:hypothetical protein
MKAFNVDLKQELRVTFSDEDKATKYFVGEDAEHAQAFFESGDMEEFVNTFSLMFANHLNSVSWASVLDIEGFAMFKRELNKFISSTDEYGDIIVEDVSRGLDVDYIY